MSVKNKIDCFDNIKVGNLKDEFEKLIKEGMSLQEQRDIGTKLALDYHQKLFNDLEGFKKLLNIKSKEKYVSPDKSAIVKKIQDDYQSKINEASIKEPEPKQAEEKPQPQKPITEDKPTAEKEIPTKAKELADKVRNKEEIEKLPKKEREIAIDNLIFGDEGEMSPDDIVRPEESVKIPSLPLQPGVGTITVRETLNHLITNKNKFSDLAKEILESADNESLNSLIGVAVSKGFRSKYLTNKDKVVLGIESANNATVIIHEIIHSTTSKKIPLNLKNPSHGVSYGKAYLKELNAYLKNPDGKQEVKTLIRLYLRAVKELGFEKQLFEGGAQIREISNSGTFTIGNSGDPYYMVFHSNDNREAANIEKKLKEVGIKPSGSVSQGRSYGWVTIINDKDEIKKVIDSGLIKLSDNKNHYQWFEYKFNYEEKSRATAGNADLTTQKGAPYGLGNLDEFLAEAFSSESFQKKLATIKDETGVSIWQRFVAAIKKLIGIETEGTLLNSVIKIGAEIISMQRDAAIKRTGELMSPINLEAAKQRMRDAGYSDEEIKAEFEKRGLPFETQQEPPPPQTPKQEPKEVGGDMGGKKKAVLNRLYNAKNVPQSAKEGFEREGLTYKPKSQKEAAEIAKSVVDEFGVDEAVELADSSSMFEGDVRTLIFAEALDRLQGEENGVKWKNVAVAMDKFERSSGRAASAVNYFYKNNPYGVQLKEEADRKEAFDKWATSKKEKSWKEFFEEFKKDPEFNQYFKEQVYEELKKERAKSRQGRIKKVRDIFAKAKASVSGKGAVYSSIIPPKIITGALDVMEKAYEAGEAVVEVVQRAIDYINKEFGTSWDSEKFREEWEDKLKEPTKAPLTEEEFKKKVLDRFRNRLKGLSDKQRDEVVRRMFDKVVNAGALEYDDLRDIIADVLGYGKLTAEEGKRLQELVKKRNAVGEAAKKAQEERTDKALEEYRLSEIEAGKAARELQELLWNKPDIIKRLTSIMQLSTLGIPSIINNLVYNFFNQLGVRFPVGLINSTIDKVGQFVANKMGKNYVREYNIFDGQAEFWAKLGVGSKEAVQQLFTGLNRQDYIQKEYYGQQIRPMRAIRDLIRWKAGEKKLTKAQVIDKALQASVGIPAEVVARFLNIGDKPQRFAAEGSQAAAFAKALGLKDIDKKLFIEFPKEEAYRAYKAQGLSDEAASTKSEYIKEAIIKEGQRSTFQQDNLLNDAITRFFGAFGGKDSGTANLVKTLTVSPYIKIPTNAFWSYYNLVNPEVAILQSFYHAGRAKMLSNKGDEVAAKLQMREARYWLAHALTGMAMRGLVVFLVQAGIFVAGNTGDESKKEREAESFFEQPGTLNISKLWALMRGEDPKKVKNGVLVSNRWFGQFGTLGNSIMRKWEDMTPEQRENQQQFWNIAFGGMELEALKEMENGIFANTSSLLDVVNTGDFSRYGLNTINMFTNILQPASIAQINRASLNEVPQAKGDTFLEKLNQNFAQRSSLYRKAFDVQLQKKRSIWGEPIPKGGNILSRMFGIFKIDEKKEGRPMYEDYLRTNDSGFLPPAVLPTMGKQKLNQEQYNKLQDYIGQSRKAIALPYIDDKAIIPVIGKKYSELNDKDGKPNDELRKAVLQYLYELGRDNGVAKFYQDYPEFKKEEKSIEQQVEESLLDAAFEIIKLQNKQY